MKYIYSISQMSKLSLTLHTFSVTGSVASLFLTLTKWRQYLLDTIETFEIWTDHGNLKYFREPHKLNRRQAR